MDETIGSSPALMSMITAARKYTEASDSNEIPFTDEAMRLDNDERVPTTNSLMFEIEKMNKAVELLYHIIAVLDSKDTSDCDLVQLASNGSDNFEMERLITKLKMIDGRKLFSPSVPKDLRNFKRALESIYNVTTRLKSCLDVELSAGVAVNDSLKTSN
jgi:hypothetical protein